MCTCHGVQGYLAKLQVRSTSSLVAFPPLGIIPARCQCLATLELRTSVRSQLYGFPGRVTSLGIITYSPCMLPVRGYARATSVRSASVRVRYEFLR